MNTPFLGGGIRTVYFIGIGGIGMSALARYFKSKGVNVSGYDRTETPLTKELVGSGIDIHYEDDPDLAPKNAELVVYTPAISPDHAELDYYRQHGYKVLKRSDVLQMISESSFNICIAGTHGKTTITTMVAHLLRHTGYGCNAFLGGISTNYNTNFWSDERDCCVIEADEFDRSFLKLKPDIAVISAMDADHLDIYGTADSVEEAFIDFSRCIRDGGLLVSKYGLKRDKDLVAAKRIRYHLSDPGADTYAKNLQVSGGRYVFDVVLGDTTFRQVSLFMGGLHNVENMLAAMSVARHLAIDEEKIKEAVAAFRGVKRRFEYIVKNSSLVFIDDYAHHPEELRALLAGARSMFPGWECTILFQPHLYSRTRDFATEFAASLDLADNVILLPIYPARESPIKGVSSQMILDGMKKDAKSVMDRNELLDWVGREFRKRAAKKGKQVLIAAGAGDIDTLLEPIKELLEEKIN